MPKAKKDILKEVRIGVRLKTKPPKAERPMKAYNRKTKHKGRIEDLPFFYACAGRHHACTFAPLINP